jgi:hypothetical protein
MMNFSVPDWLMDAFLEWLVPFGYFQPVSPEDWPDVWIG